jgi:hypothetical protein
MVFKNIKLGEAKTINLITPAYFGENSRCVIRWFKHLSNSTNDNLIFEAIEKFGGDGYLVFFAVLEILADEFDIHNPGFCEFSVKKLRKNCQISGKKLAKILHFFNEKAEKNAKKGISFFVKFDGDQLGISCPKFKKLADDYTRKQMQLLKSKNPDKNRTLSSKVPNKTTELELDIDKRTRPAHLKNGAAGLIFTKKNMGRVLDEIINKCEKIELLKVDIPKEFKTYVWVQDKINSNGHPAAIIEALDMLVARWPTVESAWAYTTAIYELKNGNYWEAEHIEESKKFKNHWGSNRKILDLIKNIGSENKPDNEKMVF